MQTFENVKLIGNSSKVQSIVQYVEIILDVSIGVSIKDSYCIRNMKNSHRSWKLETKNMHKAGNQILRVFQFIDLKVLKDISQVDYKNFGTRSDRHILQKKRLSLYS